MLTWILAAVSVGALVSRLALGYPRPPRRYRRLFRGEAALISAAADAMIPRGGPIPSSGLDADLTGYVDRLMDASHPRVRWRMHLLIFLVEHATLVFPAPGHGGFKRFSKLSAGQQVALLDAWATSQIFLRRLVFVSLRSMFTLGYFAHPPVLRQLGLAPLAIATPVCEADLLYPRIGARPESISYTPADLAPRPGEGEPLALDGPLHPAYADPAP